jgi:histidyl-tRNA synthetase
MKSMMRKANKAGARYCIIVGDDEQHAHAVTIKNMMTGEDICVPQRDMVEALRK